MESQRGVPATARGLQVIPEFRRIIAGISDIFVRNKRASGGHCVFPISVAGTVRLRVGSHAGTVKAVTNRIAGLLRQVEARSVTIDTNRVTFRDNRWRWKANSIVLLFDRGTLDVDTDGNRVRVRYRFSTTHFAVISIVCASVLGAITALGYNGQPHLKAMAALFILAWVWLGLFGAFFLSGKVYIPIWLRAGVRDLPELKAK